MTNASFSTGSLNRYQNNWKKDYDENEGSLIQGVKKHRIRLRNTAVRFQPKEIL
jgi:hypothetical protein